MSLYFKNPPKKRKKASGGRKKKRTAAQKRATAKLVAANKARRKKATAPRKARKKTSRKQTTSTKRKARKSTTKRGARKMAKRKSTKRRGKRRSSGNISLKRISGKVYRSNPPIVKQVVQGLKDAAFVKAGGVAGVMVSDMVPVTGLGKTAVKAAVAVGLGMLPVPGDGRRFIVAGAMSGVLDDLLVMAGLGKFTGAGVSAYLPSDGVSAYLSGSDSAYIDASGEALGAYVDY